jgi:hypothetical protein
MSLEQLVKLGTLWNGQLLKNFTLQSFNYTTCNVVDITSNRQGHGERAVKMLTKLRHAFGA